MNRVDIVKADLEKALEDALRENECKFSDRWYREDWLAHLENQDTEIASSEAKPGIIYSLREILSGNSGFHGYGHLTPNLDAEASWPLLFLRRGRTGMYLVEYQLDTETTVANAQDRANQIIRDRSYTGESITISQLPLDELTLPLFSRNEAVLPEGRVECVVDLTAQGVALVEHFEEDSNRYGINSTLYDLFDRIHGKKADPQEFVGQIFDYLQG